MIGARRKSGIAPNTSAASRLSAAVKATTTTGSILTSLSRGRAGGTERDEQTNTAPGEREAKRAADHSEQRALREEVAGQPSRAGAERATDRDFTVT